MMSYNLTMENVILQIVKTYIFNITGQGEMIKLKVKGTVS